MKLFLKTLILLVFSVSLFAQNESNSPYSRFGIGELNEFSTAGQSAMGGLGIADDDPISINISNPASYSSVFQQRFTMQTGGQHITKLLQTNDQSQVVNATNFNYLLFGFPLHKKIGASFGLLPYSTVSYSFSDVNMDPQADLFFDGNGGLTRLYFGNSVAISSQLSVGTNINFLFGNLNSRRKVVFSDATILNTRFNDDISMRGLYFDFGIQYKYNLGNWRSVLAMTFDNGSKIGAKRTNLTETYRLNSDIEYVEDTVSYKVLKEGHLQLPSSLGFGVKLANDKWKFLADFTTQNWSNYSLFGESDSLNNSTFLSIGSEYVPDKKAINKYYKMIRYRLGFNMTNTFLNIKNEQLTKTSIAFGFGLPLKKSGSLLNISSEIGQLGTLNNDLIRESFVRFKIGFIFSDIWFVKRKYN